MLFTVSDAVLFVSLVPADRYVEGNSLVYGSRALSFVGGPSIGGLLVQALSAPFALAADALSFLGSAFFLGRIKPVEPPTDTTGRGALVAGARFIRHSPIVRASLASVAVIDFFNYMFIALFVLYATRSLHARPGLLGLVLGAGAIGGVLGTLVTRRSAAWCGVVRRGAASSGRTSSAGWYSRCRSSSSRWRADPGRSSSGCCSRPSSFPDSA